MAKYSKEHILAQIRQTAKANGGKPLGRLRFEAETGIGYHDWHAVHWIRWNDAVLEAGLTPNRASLAYNDRHLIECLVLLTRRLGRPPVEGDLRMAARNDPSFPSENPFRRLGPRELRVSRVIAFCEENPGNEDVAKLWRAIPIRARQEGDEAIESGPLSIGYVYILKHGSRREYKIGKTNNVLRREGEIAFELPEKVKPLHYIETDDPAGVEAYWHKRFANKRKNGEWFELTADDVRAFKRWKRIH